MIHEPLGIIWVWVKCAYRKRRWLWLMLPHSINSIFQNNSFAARHSISLRFGMNSRDFKIACLLIVLSCVDKNTNKRKNRTPDPFLSTQESTRSRQPNLKFLPFIPNHKLLLRRAANELFEIMNLYNVAALIKVTAVYGTRISFTLI